jgi:hypothetical protein
VYFKHEDEARGPAFALAMSDIVSARGAAPHDAPGGASAEMLTAPRSGC